MIKRHLVPEGTRKILQLFETSSTWRNAEHWIRLRRQSLNRSPSEQEASLEQSQKGLKGLVHDKETIVSLVDEGSCDFLHTQLI